MKFTFGQYLDYDISFIVEIDRQYCEWIISIKNFKDKYPQIVDEIEIKLPQFIKNENQSVINFGKYEGLKINKLIFVDQDYCKWLLFKNETFKKEYPKTFNNLFYKYNLIYDNSIKQTILFYVLKFHNSDYIKIGITSQFIVRRIYNYACISGLYSNDNIDFKSSLVYKTDNLNIEKVILKEFKEYRIDRKSERLVLSVDEIKKYFLKNEKSFLTKKLSDFIPYKNGFDFRKKFNLKINQFQKFEELYLENLKKNKTYKFYNPDFY